MGGNNSKQINTTQFLTDLVFEQCITNEIRTKVDFNAFQSITLNVTSCDFVEIKGISQDMSAVVQSQIDFNSENVTSMQNEITNGIEQRMKETTDAIGQGLREFFAGIVGTDRESINRSDIENKVRQTFDESTIQDMQTSAKVGSDFKFNCTASRFIKIKDINQRIRAEVVMTALSKKSNYNEMVNAMKNLTKQENEQTIKGITDIVDSITSMISGMGMGYSLMIACIASVICAGFVGFIAMGGKLGVKTKKGSVNIGGKGA